MREIEGRRQATVVYGPVVTPLGERAVAAHRTRAGLLEAVRRRQRRGEIQHAYGETMRWEDGAWLMDVRVMPATARELRPRPRWAGPAKVVAAVLLTLGTLVGLGWWLFASLAAVPLAFLLIAAAVSLCGMASKGRTVGDIIVQQNVDIRR